MNNIYKNIIDKDKYVIITYYLESTISVDYAAWNIALGQSVGNPSIRNSWETEELFENNCCVIEGTKEELEKIKKGKVNIGFPVENIDFETDGISHLLVNIMGGQLDIQNIDKCSIIDIIFPENVINKFKKPKYGITGIRKYTNVYGKPLLGAIIKPKTGISPKVLLDIVKQLVDNGVNFIKEDEILSNPKFCSIKDRMSLIGPYIQNKNVVYCTSIHSDYPYLLDRAKQVYELGGNGVHINFWCGLGAYRAIRNLDLPIFIHFQKSGDKILTNSNHDFNISWQVICKLTALMGIDFIHAGMIGGYYKWPERETIEAIKILNDLNVMPALSCGFHPGLTEYVTKIVGNDYMINSGGSIHGHPGGTASGVLAIRQSIDKNYGKEYYQAIDKWGKKE
jgi:ribulose-bisphosphate carboxylase large chain